MDEQRLLPGPVSHLGAHAQPGASGPPIHGKPKFVNSGRKGLFSYRVRQRTRDGEELIDFLLHVLRGTGPYRNKSVPIQYKMQAAVELLNRAYGRPAPVFEPSEEGTLSVAGVTFIPFIAKEPLPEARVVEAETRVVPETQDARR